MTRLCEIVVRRFRQLGCDLPADDYELHRTKAGRYQRAAGAWSWSLRSSKDSRAGRFGSQYPATEIARWPENFLLYQTPHHDYELIKGNASVDPDLSKISTQYT